MTFDNLDDYESAERTAAIDRQYIRDNSLALGMTISVALSERESPTEPLAYMAAGSC